MKLALLLLLTFCTNLISTQIIRSQEDLKKYDTKENLASLNREKTFPNENNILKTNDEQDSMETVSKTEEEKVEEIVPKVEEKSHDKKTSGEVDESEQVNEEMSEAKQSVFHEFLFSIAEVTLPVEVIDVLKSTEANLLLHALLNTIFIVFVFFISCKVFFGGGANIDISALKNELTKINLESVKLQQEKNELAAEIKQANAKLKQVEKEDAKKEKEEAEKKLNNFKKERDSIKSSLVFVEQERNDKDFKLKNQVEKHEKNTAKKKRLESELKEVQGKIESLEEDIKQKSAELAEIEEKEERMKLEVEEMKVGLNDLQLKQEKATSDVEELKKRENDLEVENAMLLEKQENNETEIEEKDNRIQLLTKCLETLNAMQDNGAGTEEFMSRHVVQMKLKDADKEVEELKKTLKHEAKTSRDVQEVLSKTEKDLEKEKEEETKAKEALVAANVKMKTLSEYFKQKEADLNSMLKGLDQRDRELAGGTENNEEKLKKIEKMAEEYKEQVESLQREIQDVEGSFRKEVSVLEKKAHDNWLSYRQSERECKESNAELASLQAKITEAQQKLDEWYENNQKFLPEPRMKPNFPFPPPLRLPPPIPGFPPPPPHQIYSPPTLRSDRASQESFGLANSQASPPPRH